MKEDLNLGGNDLNYLQAVYYASYLSFMIPASFALTRLPIQRILPTMEVLWGICTFGCAWCQNLTQLYVCRFFLGGCETVAFTGLIYIIGSWYRRGEIGVRISLYTIASPLGGMISGYLQVATYTNLNGTHGLEGWRWLFVVCFCITIPCAIIGFVFFPNSPEYTKPSWWLTQADIDLTMARMRDEGIRRVDKKKVNYKRLFKKCLMNWHWYVFVFAWCLYDQNQYFSGTPFNLYLKASGKYSVANINSYPTVVKAVSIFSTLVGGYYSDKTLDRFTPCLITTLLTLLGAIILRVYDVAEGARIFAFFVAGVANSMNNFQMTWASDITKDDPEVRSLVTASMNCIGQVFLAWVPILTFPNYKAPRFEKGFTFSVITAALHVVTVTVIFLLDRRDIRIGRRNIRAQELQILQAQTVGDDLEQRITEEDVHESSISDFEDKKRVL